jgi:3-dehydroquinate dehydratase-2
VKKILLVNGPNLNMLGQREPEIYGHTTLAELEKIVSDYAGQLNYRLQILQSNHEGAIIDFIQKHQGDAGGIIINPGALAHYGYALRDCLAGTGLSIIEVHISNLQKREEWRRKSVLTEICTGLISGLGIKGYLLALEYFKDR